MNTYTITTINHPKSGETFAIEINTDGDIIHAAGPLHYSDPTDTVSLQGWLDNAITDGNSAADAAWLTAALWAD